MKILYPPSPQGNGAVPYDDTNYRKQVRKMIVSLAIFCVLYLLTILLGIGVAALCAIGGIAAMIHIPVWLGKLVGLGLVVAAFMVLFFLIKFVFENKKEDRSGYVEIFPEQYPLLFEFIEKLCAETQTQLPKHVYVSPDVNAAVFYDKNLLSMFLPVRKNLLIGLGLVNVVNLSEFKAVLAHEFGHFSQKSMKAGSYVYQVNRVIYNSLYENDSYVRLLNNWAEMHAAFAICARITYHIVDVIRWVNQQTYTMLNTQFNSLSREMEFHADAVSAGVSGSNNMVSALRKTDEGDTYYREVLNWYNELAADSRKGRNLYTDQRTIMNYFTSGSAQLVVTHNRVSINDQWRTHPTLAEREQALDKIGLSAEEDRRSPWQLFGNDTALQERITAVLYARATLPGEPTFVNDEMLVEKCRQEEEANKLPAVYSTYYNNRFLRSFELGDMPADVPPVDDLQQFCLAQAPITGKILSNFEDVSMLHFVREHPDAYKQFSFDGQKYKSAAAERIIETLNKEIEDWDRQLLLNDMAVYRYFALRSNKQDTLKALYSNFFALNKQLEEDTDACSELQAALAPLYEPIGYQQEAEELVKKLQDKVIACQERVNDTKALLARAYPHLQLPEKVAMFGERYLEGRTFEGIDNDYLSMLQDMVGALTKWVDQQRKLGKKQLLEQQLALLQ